MKFFSINYAVVILSFFFINCINKEKDENNSRLTSTEIVVPDKQKIDKFINVYFIQKGTTFPMRLGCVSTKDDGEPSKNMFYRKVSEQNFMDDFTQNYNELTISNEQSDIDVRIKVFVHFGNKMVDTLCLGEHHGIVKNGTRMKDSVEFLNLVKKGIKYETTFRDSFEKYRTKK